MYIEIILDASCMQHANKFIKYVCISIYVEWPQTYMHIYLVYRHISWDNCSCNVERPKRELRTLCGKCELHFVYFSVAFYSFYALQVSTSHSFIGIRVVQRSFKGFIY